MPDDDSIAKLLAELREQLDILTHAVKALSVQHGGRLNRQQFADRLGIHRNTLAAFLARDHTMPRPGNDGKWMLTEIIDWELRSQLKRYL
ncbi:hypothetical protein ACFIQF_12910 [Comamonas sp. J-3]|uniref:hypothetical protein n=1 Tax=Comamonas trifloxystrobinivorans TaxID=3350256 RepID=UPI0037272574